jgi:hypothetical protein
VIVPTYLADLEIVWGVPGEDLMDLRNRDSRAGEPTMMRLAESLAMTRGHRPPFFGKVALIDVGGMSGRASCEQAALVFALRRLAEATARDQRLADARDQLEERLCQPTAPARPRAQHSVVHDELGLEHVIVDRDGRPVRSASRICRTSTSRGSTCSYVSAMPKASISGRRWTAPTRTASRSANSPSACR